ncbi:MAG TPA: hypothetical protein DEA65_00310 [Candidatus Marinimicrobia bacterium]|nr:hypothetical protein [Candidatus Neomarinimicrobiota bacterium]MDP7094596.1 hypothetical protein [Candidatus Neomarinimicrobiota bacterium]MDP7512759.1 hypothetical protein [Candidatus Neomarinimicrobiota bacterium]HBR86272.1 hypothetical protein [Candidatus Neomarinimicrobiota bacterium]HJL73940.1 hypothetical protein [Candidatus Neomarinimicrobiota bacterium]
MIIPIITLIISVILFIGSWRNEKRILFLIQLCIIYALVTTGWYNIQHNPHLIIWLCNITAVIGLILSFRFNQKLFDIFFYFAWTGDLLTLLIWPNPVSPPLETYPLSWAGFVLKHTAPLALTILFIKQGQLLNKNAAWTALKVMLIYAGFISIYNLLFDQNILDLRYPTLDIELLFGDWPLYIGVNILLAFIWYYVIHVITNRMKLVKVL